MIGTVGIAAAVILFFIGSSVYQNGVNTAWLESMSKGEALMRTGNFLKFCGFGIGAAGLAALVGGFVKKD